MSLCTVFYEQQTFLEFSESPAKPLLTPSKPNQNFLARYHVALPTAISAMTSSDKILELPATFRPTEFDVVLGRGKGSYNTPGSRKLRAIIRQFVPEYSAARSKFDKSTVLARILDAVKDENNARFVRCNQGTWYEISDDQAREKIGHTMRETIALLRSGKSSPTVISSRKSPSTLPVPRRSWSEISRICPISPSRENPCDYLDALTNEHQENGTIGNPIAPV
jgi:hypothetical protein